MGRIEAVELGLVIVAPVARRPRRSRRTSSTRSWSRASSGSSPTSPSTASRRSSIPTRPWADAATRSGAASFLYLEVLDASFSFDGVIGAFALSNNLFIIAIGLGIGAMFVRSLTIMLVDKGTLTSYRYLEHGAFYAIIALARDHVPEDDLHVPEARHRPHRRGVHRARVPGLGAPQPRPLATRVELSARRSAPR